MKRGISATSTYEQAADAAVSRRHGISRPQRHGGSRPQRHGGSRPQRHGESTRQRNGKQNSRKRDKRTSEKRKVDHRDTGIADLGMREARNVSHLRHRYGYRLRAGALFHSRLCLTGSGARPLLHTATSSFSARQTNPLISSQEIGATLPPPLSPPPAHQAHTRFS